MAWLILVLSGVLEAVWASALSASQGFRRRGPVAMTQLPTGTAYAVWVGIGATLTVVWAMVTRQERASTARILLLVLLVASVVGLKAVS
jgi:quaternary ammonium compound-resistance protein SugE